MDIPAGRPLGEGMDVEKVDFRKLLPRLKNLNLTGYVAISVMTKTGSEEGILLFDSGKIIGAEYTYLGPNIVLSGDKALPAVLNACASHGIFDIYELNSTDVAGARNSKPSVLLSKLPSDEDITNMIPDTFTEVDILSKSEEKKEIKPELKKPEKLNREAIFKKYGISAPDMKKLDNMLKQLGV